VYQFSANSVRKQQQKGYHLTYSMRPAFSSHKHQTKTFQEKKTTDQYLSWTQIQKILSKAFSTLNLTTYRKDYTQQASRIYPRCTRLLLCPWGSPGKNAEVGCRALLQGLFPMQRLHPSVSRLLHRRGVLHACCHRSVRCFSCVYWSDRATLLL